MFQQIDSFIRWIQNFDYSLLQNEADVETKFIIKLFEHLDYTDTLRRDKFQVPGYQPFSQKKRGKKPEADYVYFSVTDPLEQTEDTSLVVIEVKRPEKTLQEALYQAQFYAYFLKTPFLVLSNGYNLQVWKHREYQTDEKVFDVTLDELQTEGIAKELYQLLNYSVVKQLKKDLFSETTHAMYVHLISTLKQYPNLQHLLRLGDFRPSTYMKGNLYVVEQPKVKISCELPVFLKKGSCQVEFSNIMLRGLAVYLSHQDILNSLLVGLNTIPSCKTRPFLTKQTKNSFEVILGQTIVQLNIDEVNDLCSCIDIVGEKYQEILMETADILETWNYSLHEIQDGDSFGWGYCLIYAKTWVWELVKRFAREFDCLAGNSNWHIFEMQGLDTILVGDRQSDHAKIRTVPATKLFAKPVETVRVLYQPAYTHRTWNVEHWKSVVGHKGIWTAEYTKNWLVSELIPKVLLHYADEIQSNFAITQLPPLKRWLFQRFFGEQYSFVAKQRENNEKLLKDLIDDANLSEEVPFEKIAKPEELALYLHSIQAWFLTYEVDDIPAKLLNNYYNAFTLLAKQTSPTSIDVSYVCSKLNRAERLLAGDDNAKYYKTFADIILCLENHVQRIESIEYENQGVAELLSRVFIAFIEGGVINFSQKDLNMAKEVVKILWRHCRFYEHFMADAPSSHPDTASYRKE